MFNGFGNGRRNQWRDTGFGVNPGQMPAPRPQAPTLPSAGGGMWGGGPAMNAGGGGNGMWGGGPAMNTGGEPTTGGPLPPYDPGMAEPGNSFSLQPGQMPVPQRPQRPMPPMGGGMWGGPAMNPGGGGGGMWNGPAMNVGPGLLSGWGGRR